MVSISTHHQKIVRRVSLVSTKMRPMENFRNANFVPAVTSFQTPAKMIKSTKFRMIASNVHRDSLVTRVHSIVWSAPSAVALLSTKPTMNPAALNVRLDFIKIQLVTIRVLSVKKVPIKIFKPNPSACLACQDFIKILKRRVNVKNVTKGHFQMTPN